MTWVQAAILGFVQGATEFLPISSSGHLVLVPWLLGWEFKPATAFVFDVLVQWGTLLAVVFYFRAELADLIRTAATSLLAGQPLREPAARLAWLLVLTSVPAAAAGLLWKDSFEASFTNPRAVSAFLLATAALLAASELVGRRRRSMQEVGGVDALVIGLAQALSLFPGISRSGATIAAGLGRHLSRPEAARFSFLMSVPIMFGAGLVALSDLAQAADMRQQLPALLVGFSMAALTGFAAIRWLLGHLARRSLVIFVVYCSLAGALGLVLTWP